MPHHNPGSCNTTKNNFGGFLLLKLCLMASMTVFITKAQNHSNSNLAICNSSTKGSLKNNIVERNDSNYLQLPHILPFRMDSFIGSLLELELEENHKRKKKSIKRSGKKIEATELRGRIKDLMTNISRTLNDVDWYFAYEQLENQKNKDKEYFVSEPTQKLVIKRMREVDEDISDVFVDSFVQQMYELDPSILDKINDRILSEISSVKREARLASTRKTNVKTAFVNEEYAYVDSDDDSGDQIFTKMPNYLNGINKIFKQQRIDQLLDYDPNLKEIAATTIETTTIETTTIETTTYENFYDYGDYYRENEEDKLRQVAHYEIVQDVLHSTPGVIKDYDGDSYKVEINNKNKKTRNFHRNKEILKKKLKDRLENFKLQTYKDYNIDSDY